MRNLTIKAASWAQTRRFHQEEEGQTVIEYALVVGVVSAALVGVLFTAGTGWIKAVTTNVTSALGQ
jgi:Flp pilus assembly pilin Flp